MPLRAVLFDLDGTLREGLGPGEFDAVCAYTARLIAPVAGMPGGSDGAALVRDFWAALSAPYDGMADLRQPDSFAAFRSFLAARGFEPSREAAMECWRLMHEDVPRVFMRLFDDTLPTMARLRESRIATAVVTNNSANASQLRRVLGDFEMAPEVVISSADVGYRKPHRLVFSRALQTLGMRPQDVVMVGDSFENDVLGARGFGITAVLKTNGRVPSAEEVAGADHVIADLNGLFELHLAWAI